MERYRSADCCLAVVLLYSISVSQRRFRADGDREGPTADPLRPGRSAELLRLLSPCQSAWVQDDAGDDRTLPCTCCHHLIRVGSLSTSTLICADFWCSSSRNSRRGIVSSRSRAWIGTCSRCCPSSIVCCRWIIFTGHIVAKELLRREVNLPQSHHHLFDMSRSRLTDWLCITAHSSGTLRSMGAERPLHGTRKTFR